MGVEQIPQFTIKHFSSTIWHQSFHEASSLHILHINEGSVFLKKVVSYRTDNVSCQRCCRIWLLSMRNVLAKYRSCIANTSIECYPLAAPEWRGISLTFPVLKDFHYQHVPIKWLLGATQARKLWLKAVRHDGREPTPTCNKIFFIQFRMTSPFL